MTDRSWDYETIQLFDKLESQIRQLQAEIEALKDEVAELKEDADRVMDKSSW